MSRVFELPESLRESASYPEDASAGDGVEHAETHISHLFFTRERVYKFRKAVDRGFLDFRERAERNADCLREIVLNRRLAPDVYLGVAPLRNVGGRAQIGPVSDTLARPAAASGEGANEDFEHCVVMRRLAAGEDAQTRLEQGRLRPEHLDVLARQLADFHRTHRLDRGRVPDAKRAFERVAGATRANLDALESQWQQDLAATATETADVASRVAALRERVEAELHRIEPWLERRRRLGLQVDGHGDLRLEHVWFEADDVALVIDCIEFDAELREGDPAADLGFFAMDLLRRGHPDRLQRFLQQSVWQSDDYSVFALLDHFIAYSACVRAKVEPGHAELIGLAEQVLAARPQPVVFMLCGMVGTGKSSVAAEVARHSGGLIVTSDRVRQRFSDLMGWQGEDLYREAAKAAVYAGLLERAQPVVESGRCVVLDATYGSAERRDQALGWASKAGLRVVLVEARADARLTLERLERRQHDPDEPSEAGPELYARSVAGFDPVTVGRGLAAEVEHVVVDTGAENWRSDLERTLRGFAWVPSAFR